MASTLEIPQLAIVVPAHNEEGPGITRLLDSLRMQQTLGNQIVKLYIVENGSTDKTLHKVETWKSNHEPKVKPKSDDTPDEETQANKQRFTLTILKLPKNNVASAMDFGFRTAIEEGAKIVARTDADCEPEPDWALRISKNFLARPKLQLLGGRVIALRDKDYRIGDTVWNDLEFMFRRGLFGRLVLGNNMALRSSSYLQLNPDESNSSEVPAKPDDTANKSIGDLFRDQSPMSNDLDALFTRLYLAKFGMRGVHIDRKLIVAASMRRPRKYGFLGMAEHLIFRSARNGIVDVRSKHRR